MNSKAVIGSTMAAALLGMGMLAGTVVGNGQAFAQTPPAAATAVPSAPSTRPAQPAITAAITQQQAEQAALAASPGNTVDHTNLNNQSGTAEYDVDFANGGGVRINAQTGAVIAKEAAGADSGGGHGRGGGADQAALAAKATVTQAQAEKAALAASPGSTVDHSRLGDENGTVYWDIDFSNGGGVKVNATTGAVIANEAAGTDQGGHGHGGPENTAPGTASPGGL